MSTYAPTPWQSERGLAISQGLIFTADQQTAIGETFIYEDAQFIVRAVNSHAELLEIAKTIFKMPSQFNVPVDLVEKASKAIAKAEGGPQ